MKPLSILTLGLAALAMAVPASTAPQPNASWKPSSELLKQLQPSPAIAGFTIQHPKGYQVQKATLYGTFNGIRWISPARVDGTNGVVIITWLSLPKKEMNRYSLTQYLAQGLDLAKPHMVAWSRTAAQKGTINGQPFYRAYWSGKNIGNQVNMRGFMYITKAGNRIVELGSQDFVPDEEKYLALAEASILTFKAK